MKEIAAEVERINAKIELLNQSKEALNERLAQLMETIGEHRGMISETQREIEKIKVDVQRAVELVEEMQPEQVIQMLRKGDVKLEGVSARVDSLEAYLERIKEEISKLREATGKFIAVEEIVKQAERLTEAIAFAKRIEATIKMHADKVENVFMQVESEFVKYRKLAEDVERLADTAKNLEKGFGEIKFALPSFLKREEFQNLVELGKRLEKKEKEIEEISARTKELTEVSKGIEREMEEIEVLKQGVESLRREITALKKSLDRLDRLDASFYALKAELKGYVKTAEIERLAGKVAEGLASLEEERLRLRKDISDLIRRGERQTLQVSSLRKEWRNLTAKVKVAGKLVEWLREERELLKKEVRKIDEVMKGIKMLTERIKRNETHSKKLEYRIAKLRERQEKMLRLIEELG